ncbi:MAG: TraV family lipoprotein [Vitreoscilla sp.]|jgi:conjugal transfer pilus assembly protein TraV|nr:TraV family lipoprotein [Vitreoscilla sp.]
MRRARPSLIGALAVATSMLGACTSMSGLSGSSSYACKAPEGVTCDSVSGTYANAVHNNLPSQRSRSVAAAPASGSPPSAPPPQPSTSASATPTPLRSSARILRLWFKPWEDADRDLYDQGYVYVQINSGEWLIEHARRQIREAYAPLRPPPKASASGGADKDAATPTPLLPNLKSAPKPPSGDNPFPGLVPSPARPDTSD